MMNSDQIFQDLMGEGSSVIQDITPPYSNDTTLEDKFNSLYRALRRSIKLRARISFLTNAYLLRKLLNDIETPALQSRYKQKLTSHYTTIVTYTFDLFEYLPAHIYVTKFLNVQIIRKMKRVTILKLRNKVLGYLARAQNLEEKDC